jgi:hypothetical protein
LTQEYWGRNLARVRFGFNALRRLGVGAVGLIGTTAFGLWLDRQGVSDTLLIVAMLVSAGIVVLLTIKTGRRSIAKTEHTNHPSWTEIETRFKELHTRVHRFPVSLDQYRGEDGKQRWLVSASIATHGQAAERVCRLAGGKLKASGLADDSSRLSREPMIKPVVVVPGGNQRS